uniref:Uncharacterized protein n=1 Tax=Solanum lycopersicum TaxID=4081 RepID=A0A3Q7HLW6_SOLLC
MNPCNILLGFSCLRKLTVQLEGGHGACRVNPMKIISSWLAWIELVSSPSTRFMDEPISALNATAAAIVMRIVRNEVDTGRTVTNNLILLQLTAAATSKMGGEETYVVPLGHHSFQLIKYFEVRKCR